MVAGGALSAEGHQYRGFIWSQGAEHLAIVFQSCLLEAQPPFKGSFHALIITIVAPGVCVSDCRATTATTTATQPT